MKRVEIFLFAPCKHSMKSSITSTWQLRNFMMKSLCPHAHIDLQTPSSIQGRSYFEPMIQTGNIIRTSWSRIRGRTHKVHQTTAATKYT